MVHDALETRLTRAFRVTALLATCAGLLAAATVLAGCGEAGSSSASTFPTHLRGPVTADVGESARSDTCAQWEQGTVQQRHGALARLRKFATSPIGSSNVRKYGPTLSDSRAYRLFDSLCAKHFARAFKLYKLYERAAAFLGPRPR